MRAIFVSYSRNDAKGEAGRLVDDLMARVRGLRLLSEESEGVSPWQEKALRKLVCGGAEIGFGRLLERVGGRGSKGEAR